VIPLTDPGEIREYKKALEGGFAMVLKLFLLWLLSVATIILFFMGAFPRNETERAPLPPSVDFTGQHWD
jgi:hypothetical protein